MVGRSALCYCLAIVRSEEQWIGDGLTIAVRGGITTVPSAVQKGSHKVTRHFWTGVRGHMALGFECLGSEKV